MLRTHLYQKVCNHPAADGLSNRGPSKLSGFLEPREPRLGVYLRAFTSISQLRLLQRPERSLVRRVMNALFASCSDQSKCPVLPPHCGTTVIYSCGIFHAASARSENSVGLLWAQSQISPRSARMAADGHKPLANTYAAPCKIKRLGWIKTHGKTLGVLARF